MASELNMPNLLENQIRIPQKNVDKIYKDECIYSFDTPECDTGIYVNLKTFFGLGKDYVKDYYDRTGLSIYLHLKRVKREIPPDHASEGPEKKITRLAIGVEGGFDPDAGKPKYEYDDHHSIVILPSFKTIPLSNDADISSEIKEAVKVILESDSSSKLAELEALSGTWDGEIRVVTKHADSLLQIDNGIKIPPSGWQCEKCDLTENLWLNLTDGSILCGRRFFDGSGGNDHAVEHYRKTGYPLAVKLRTITKEGKADVYSYDEDDMVEDPQLIKHLSHFGINIQQMERTEKSMAELELDLNQKLGEWVALQEASSQLKPLYGPGYTGLANLGNSCYLNSVMQVIFTIPDFIKRYVTEGKSIIQSASLSDPASDFNVQMVKLGNGLLSGKYSCPPPNQSEETQSDLNYNQPGISPIMFKTLIGKGHPDFSTKRQQDAQEFFMYFINVLERNSRHRQNPAECFKFKVEDRFECTESKKVKYNYRSEYSLPLPIPLELACNKEEVAAYEAAKEEAQAKGIKSDNQNIIRPKIKLKSCLDCFSQSDNVEQFYSSALNKKTVAVKTTRLATFPDYLLLHLKKFTVKEDWKPIKLDVSVEMPDTLDLSTLRGKGLQPGEEPLPDLKDDPPAIVIDQEIYDKLSIMGFSPDACKRALYFTENRGIEEASNWLMEHIGDSDINDPFVPPGINPSKGFKANEEAVQMIISMGFTRVQAVKALKATDNNVERAADWIFSHSAELDADESENETVSEPEYRDGDTNYRLVAFISHMGTSTMVGHYVCHILKDGHWVIFNDNKVALSENPPKDLGYLYLYERIQNKV